MHCMPGITRHMQCMYACMAEPLSEHAGSMKQSIVHPIEVHNEREPLFVEGDCFDAGAKHVVLTLPVPPFSRHLVLREVVPCKTVLITLARGYLLFLYLYRPPIILKHACN